MKQKESYHRTKMEYAQSRLINILEERLILYQRLLFEFENKMTEEQKRTDLVLLDAMVSAKKDVEYADFVAELNFSDKEKETVEFILSAYNL